MALKLSNNSISRLAAAITDSATSISVASGDGAKFPILGAGDYFPATLSKPDGSYEIIKVTARSSDTLTAIRAQEGTTALAFDANTLIELRLTAATVETINTLAAGSLQKAGDAMTGDLIMGAGTKIVLEGTADDAFEVTVDPGSPTADRTLTIPDKSGTIATTGDVFTTSNLEDDSVTTAKIGNGQVTGAKMASGAAAANLGLTNWTVTESAGKLYFAYSGVNKISLDSSGNIIAAGNVTAYGTP